MRVLEQLSVSSDFSPKPWRLVTKIQRQLPSGRSLFSKGYEARGIVSKGLRPSLLLRQRWSDSKYWAPNHYGESPPPTPQGVLASLLHSQGCGLKGKNLHMDTQLWPQGARTQAQAGSSGSQRHASLHSPTYHTCSRNFSGQQALVQRKLSQMSLKYSQPTGCYKDREDDPRGARGSPSLPSGVIRVPSGR